MIDKFSLKPLLLIFLSIYLNTFINFELLFLLGLLNSINFPKLKDLKKNIDERNKNQTLKILNELVKEWDNQNNIN